MSSELDVFQSRLEKHFRALGDSRRDRSLPLFALEHGLNAEELSSISTLLKAALRAGWYNLSKHWLVWIVYATEQGYDYDGDEYWHSFQSAISQRFTLQDRETIRDWFHLFMREFMKMLSEATAA